MHRLWPRKIITPHVQLAIPLSEGLKILNATGGSLVEGFEHDGKMHRVNLPNFEMAVYETNGKVSSVWYNDPAGRWTGLGRNRKLRLYMDRYTESGAWEKRLNNGWMTFYFNDTDGVSLVHGTHMDVIRINKSEGSCADTVK